jgi:hypothetical protein
MGLEEAEVPGCQTFRKVVREEIDVDLHCTSARFRRRGYKSILLLPMNYPQKVEWLKYCRRAQ